MSLPEKRYRNIRLSVLVVFCGFAIFGFTHERTERVLAFSSGPPAGFSAAPGEDDCTVCHSNFPVNSGKGSVAITGLPHDYLPGQQIQVQVKTSDPAALIFGFQLTAIDKDGATRGTFTLPPSADPPTQMLDGVIGNSDRIWVEHTSSGLFDPMTTGSNTWTFTWTAPPQRVGKMTFYATGNAANSDGSPQGDFIYTTERAVLAGSAIANFDGDIASDIAVFRPRTASWENYNILTGASQNVIFGTGTDRIVPGDYDGDGTTDRALYRSSTAEWRIQQSTAGFILVNWGNPGDIPVPGDYDADGRTDVAVFRPATGLWSINRSTAGAVTFTLGQAGDKPVQADYDGDAKTNIAVYRPSTGAWYVNDSSTPFIFPQRTIEDKPVQGDFDGDGKTDMAIFQPSSGVWRIKKSSGGMDQITFGTALDQPAPADYDGDGKTDLASFNAREKRSGGVWQILKSSDGITFTHQLGQARDVPVALGYLPQ